MERLGVHEPLLVNTIGHSVGAILFAVFLYLGLRDQAGVRLRASRMSLAAAGLALTWNVASLLVVAVQDAGLPGAGFASGLGLTALTLLPAVLLQLAVGSRSVWLCRLGFLFSIVSIGFHWSEFMFDAPQFHARALRVTTIGFALLTILAAITILRGRAKETGRLFGTMALFLFALSFVHFGFEFKPGIWQLEVIVHHAGIPVAMFVLLQDYRFVFLDALVRVLANLTVAGAALVATFWLLARTGIEVSGITTPFRGGLLFVAASLALVGFAVLRGWFQQLLTRVLFRRGNLDDTLAALRRHEEAPEGYIAWAMARVGRYIEAQPVEASAKIARRLRDEAVLEPVLAGRLPSGRDLLTDRDVEVITPLRMSPGEVRYFFFGRRPGGRPYLSEDLEALRRLTEQVAEHMMHYRDIEMRRLMAQAELKALQAQIHPHFLFNALNSLYGVIPREAKGARQTVLNLADILRYFLQSGRTWIPLEEELNIVRAYLEVERLRLGERLETGIDVDPEALGHLIPMLSVQPLVENAVKHGISRQAGGGVVRLRIGCEGGWLEVMVSDTGPGFAESPAGGDGHGLGLENVNRRLQLCYGEECRLRVESSAAGAVVGFRAPVRQVAEVIG
jgi:signal transduction histidine kinase